MVQRDDPKSSDNIKVVLLSAMTISLSLAFLWHLSNILRFGSQLIYEPNKLVLLLEIIGMGGVLITGLTCFWLQLRTGRK